MVSALTNTEKCLNSPSGSLNIVSRKTNGKDKRQIVTRPAKGVHFTSFPSPSFSSLKKTRKPEDSVVWKLCGSNHWNKISWWLQRSCEKRRGWSNGNDKGRLTNSKRRGWSAASSTRSTFVGLRRGGGMCELRKGATFYEYGNWLSISFKRWVRCPHFRMSVETACTEADSIGLSHHDGLRVPSSSNMFSGGMMRSEFAFL